MFSLATPFPGTELWDSWVKKRGALGPEDYERAYYYDEGRGGVSAFYNLSEVETAKLECFVREAQSFFERRKAGASFKRRYGRWIGPLAHLAYRITGNRVERETVKT
jgi:hypothetical protein